MTKLETAYIITLCVSCFIAGALTATLFFWACLEQIS